MAANYALTATTMVMAVVIVESQDVQAVHKVVAADTEDLMIVLEDRASVVKKQQ
jgi:hypothetical protein